MAKREVYGCVVHLGLGEVSDVITKITSFVEETSEILHQA